MARDYRSRRPAARSPSRPAPKKRGTVLLSFLCGYLLSAVVDIASLSAWVTAHFARHPGTVSTQVATEKPAAPKIRPRPKPKFEFYTLLSKDHNALQAVANKQDMAAINTPPEQKIPLISSSSAARSAVLQTSQAVPVGDSKAVKPIKPVLKETFFIQVASFPKRAEADNLRASLMLRGIDVVIVSVTQGNTPWFRVVAGPFRSRGDAEKAQAALARHEHIKGMIRKNDV